MKVLSSNIFLNYVHEQIDMVFHGIHKLRLIGLYNLRVHKLIHKTSVEHNVSSKKNNMLQHFVTGGRK